MKKHMLKTISVGMSAVMVLSLAGCGAATVQDAVTDKIDDTKQAYTEQQLQNIIDKSTGMMHSDGEAGKIETVYVNSDANGDTREIIVSDWLKNPEGNATIADESDLTDIVNVKGKETYDMGEDGHITWNAEGSDIYYQGHSDAQLPINVKVTYTLDGKEISPEELAGKSGEVTIRFDYINNSKQTVSVDDKDYDVYTPFAVVSGLMLDAGKFSNVNVTGGKVISDADNYIVMGLALPGFKDSLDVSNDALEELNIDADEVGIPDHFEISAHTTDFRLGMTMTMASSDMMSSLGLEDLSENDAVDKVRTDMDELSDGSNKLVNGTETLKTGTSALKDGAGKINDGALALQDGAGQLKDGAVQLKDGAGQLMDGTASLKDGAGQLNEGARKLYEGAGSLNSGAQTLHNGTKELNEGTAALYNGIVDYTKGTEQINEGASTLAAGADKLKEGSAALRKGFSDNDIAGNSKKLAAGAGQVSAGVDKLIAALSGLGSTKQELTQDATDLYVIYNMMSAFENGTYSYAGQGTFAAYVTGSGYDTAEGFNAVLSKYLGTDLASLDGLVGMYLQNRALYDGLNTSGSIESVLPAMMLDMHREASYAVDMPTYGESVDDAGIYTAGTITRDEKGSEETSDAAECTKESTGKAADEVTDVKDVPGGKAADAAIDVKDESGENAADAVTDVKDESGEKATDAAADVKAESDGSIEGDATEAAEAENGSESDKEATLTDKDAKDTQQKTQTVKVIEKTGMSAEDKMTAGAYIAYDEKFQSVKASCYAIYSVLSQMGAMFDEMGANPDDLTALSKGASDVATGAAALAGGLDTIGNGINSLDDGIAQLAGGADKLVGGTGTLTANNKKLVSGANDLKEGASRLNDGAGTLYNGTTDLYNGAGTLYNGTTDLYNGAETLYEGTGRLYNGAGALSDGAGSLYDGAGELHEGTTELYNGAVELDAGVVELENGMIKLDEEGIRKVYNIVDTDMSDYFGRLKAIKEAGENYTSFTKTSDGMDGNVKFIIKTDAVK